MIVRLERARTVERLERRVGRQAGVAELARAALDGGPLVALLDLAATLVAELLPAAGCEIYEVSADGELLRVAPAVSASRPAAAPSDEAALTSLATTALRSADPVPALDPATAEPVQPATRWPPARFVSVRIAGRGQPYGVLSAYTTRPRIFDAEEMEFLSTVASVLAVAVTRRRAEDAIRFQTLHDSLTGLPNRTLLWDRLVQATRRADRTGEAVGVLVADLDGFRAVNDALGHAAGDAVLVAVAERLRGCLRAGDTVARLGGDEFGICLPGLTTVEQAAAVAAKLTSALDRPLRLGEVSVPLSANVGVAVFPHHGTDAATVLQRADLAMYQAKIAQRPVATYLADSAALNPRRLSLAGELARAIDNDELELDYQPLVDLTSGAVRSVEALVRWRDVGGAEVLAASDLVFLAEHGGMIRRLSAWVLDRALRQVGQWQQQGVELRVAVNVSGGVLEDTGFRDQLIGTLKLAGLAPARLSLEITESVLLSEHARAALSRLAAEGIAISIDDFGTGYASLSYLKHLPVSQLKVDRSFVTRVAEDPRDLAIVRSVVDLAHALGVQVVVEGVEDAAAAELLRGLSADLAQGFLFSRPVPPDQLTSWLLSRPDQDRPPARQLTLPEAIDVGVH